MFGLVVRSHIDNGYETIHITAKSIQMTIQHCRQLVVESVNWKEGTRAE